jgi:hypothetical protein
LSKSIGIALRKKVEKVEKVEEKLVSKKSLDVA